MNEKKNLIMEHITEQECCYMMSDNLFACDSCDNFEDCYMNACEKCNQEFAESIDYGGCNTEEEFWEQFD